MVVTESDAVFHCRVVKVLRLLIGTPAGWTPPCRGIQPALDWEETEEKCWRDYVSHLVSERLGITQEEPGGVGWRGMLVLLRLAGWQRELDPD